ncbi:cytochrome c oxidase subunit 3 [Paracidobacterium acidisoli]|uniref:Heme-copper oxidase subunit III n=1 Tax=Paracidobacterium acidisoli TaxID=2303751 RepID=A0A372IP33_9BACT|nr:cytochrome c oxidase subunit 3 [Paracidobacterium acidisoli]MBT9330955.1 cytochrome c oxidase subunit 3 [Paracidobacterium acidisoli]
MSAIPTVPELQDQPWHLPSRGRIGMLSLIIGESAIFTIFVVAYVFYIGKSLSGPTPGQVLEVPIFNTICLLSSSITIWLAERRIERNEIKAFGLWWGVTIALGVVFLVGTGLEWYKLIYHDGLTISTNLFGTTFYSLVGLHATHVVIGLAMLLLVLVFTLMGRVTEHHAERIQVLALYWHFVDAVWVVVFTVVYIVGR